MDNLGVHFDGKVDSKYTIYCDRGGRFDREFTKDPGKVTCEACLHKLLRQGLVKPTIGTGATELMYSDRHTYTVIAISPSGKTATLQADTETRVDNNGVSEAQSYRWEPNPKGEIVKVRLTKNGWQSKGRRFAIGYRDTYYDYSF